MSEPLHIDDFPHEYRFKMVNAYRRVSGVEDPHSATLYEIDEGFAKCLLNRHLEMTHRLYLEVK